MTLSRQIDQVEALLAPEEPVTLIGSSFGGLTAAWLAQKHSQVVQLFLLAPAFEFAIHWLPRLGDQYRRWQETGVLEVYHYTKERLLPLSYGFAKDLLEYDDRQLQRPVPTLIFHGLQDEVIPIEASRRYCEGRPWVSRVELDSDHALKDVQPGHLGHDVSNHLSAVNLRGWVKGDRRNFCSHGAKHAKAAQSHAKGKPHQQKGGYFPQRFY